MIKILTNYIPREPFNVLVSGGIDSIAAAHWLKFRFKKNFQMIHFNHCYQEANIDMESKVRLFSDTFDIPLTVIHNRGDCVDTDENSLRQWRLDCLERLVFKTKNFVTAHHLNDVVENYLDNCLKGCPEYKPIQEVTNFKNFNIYHPFLTTSKNSFYEYCDKNDLNRFISIDPTNSNTKYKRNWIRNNLAKEIYDRNIGIEKVIIKKFYLNEVSN